MRLRVPRMKRALLQLVGLATWTFALVSFAVVIAGFVVHLINGGAL